jgi:hypothetical protein
MTSKYLTGALDDNVGKFYKGKIEGRRSNDIKQKIGNYNAMTDAEKAEFEHFAEILKREPLKQIDKEWDAKKDEWIKVNEKGRASTRLVSDRTWMIAYLKKKGFSDADDSLSAGEFVRAYSDVLIALGKHNWFIIPHYQSLMFARSFYMAMDYDDIVVFGANRQKALVSLFKWYDLKFGFTKIHKIDGKDMLGWVGLTHVTKTREFLADYLLKNWDKVEADFVAAKAAKDAIAALKINQLNEADISHCIWGAYALDYELPLQTVTIRKEGLKPAQAAYIKRQFVDSVFTLLAMKVPGPVNLKIKLTEGNKEYYGAPKTEEWFINYKAGMKFLKALVDITRRAVIGKELLNLGNLNKSAVRDYSNYQNVA